MKKSYVEQDLARFQETCSFDEISEFVSDVWPLLELFEGVEEWATSPHLDAETVKLLIIKASYIMSKIAENHGEMLYNIKILYPNLYKRLEKKANNS